MVKEFVHSMYKAVTYKHMWTVSTYNPITVMKYYVNMLQYFILHFLIRYTVAQWIGVRKNARLYISITTDDAVSKDLNYFFSSLSPHFNTKSRGMLPWVLFSIIIGSIIPGQVSAVGRVGREAFASGTQGRCSTRRQQHTEHGFLLGTSPSSMSWLKISITR